MNNKIFLIQQDNSLQPMTEQPYLSEDRFQVLLANYPDLLAGDQIDEGQPRRWLLVSREVGIPGTEDGNNRWALDHLFLDQDGIPTLVEVKRSDDTRIRREVVGQMLDYAANAVVYWPIETIRSYFEARCEINNDDPAQLITELLQEDFDKDSKIETFWEQVKTNLKAGRIRLIFVADIIPPELRRIVEFLNTQMDPAEVLAVEIKRFVGQGVQTLVPKVIGHSVRAEKRQGGGSGDSRQWDESLFLQEVETRCGKEVAQISKLILVWSKEKMPSIWWGKGNKSGGFIPGIDHKGRWHQLIEVWTYGKIELQFQYMKSKSPPFDTEENRLQFLRRCNQIPGIKLPESSLSQRPSFSISVLNEEKNLAQFLDTLEWAIQEILKY